MVKKDNWTIEENLKLIELFKLGYTSKKIGEKLNRTKEAVQKRIQMFKKKEIICEKNRKLKQIESREINKAINRENNKFMSNRALIKSSISAYKNNHKGDLVLDTKKAKEQGFVYTLDMPKSIINREIREFNKIEEKNKDFSLIEYVKHETERLKDLKKEVRKVIEEISV